MLAKFAKVLAVSVLVPAVAAAEPASVDHTSARSVPSPSCSASSVPGPCFADPKFLI